MTKVATNRANTNKRQPIIAGLDIGSTKVSLVIGTVTQKENASGHLEHGIDIVGLGTAPNNGIRQGVVVNVEATIEAIT
ncbi:MAG: hypothetical protein AAB250_08700, partial [Bdellovibrionota bacterium]